MDDKLIRYEKDSETLYYNIGSEILSDAVSTELSRIKRSGSYEGEDIREVVVVYSEDSAAKEHAPALAFLQLTVAGPSGRVTEGIPSFSTRTDFGIE